MHSLLRKKMLLTALFLFAVYWAVGNAVPRPYFANAMSLLAILAGGMMMFRYAEATWHILMDEEKSPYGGHLAVLGAFTMSAGFVYSGIFSLLWQHFGANPAWLSTVTSSFGRAMMSAGFYLMAIGPDTSVNDGDPPPKLMRMFFTAFAIAVAFVAGTHVGSPG